VGLIEDIVISTVVFLVASLRNTGGTVFQGANSGKPLSNMSMLMMVRRIRAGLTVHGFRSTFRDWVSEETDHSPEVAEMALAHTIGNKVEKAYRRGKLLERRRLLMKEWESYCLTGSHKNVFVISRLAA
jgi:integrase